jgi:hypothetical protein
MGPDLPQEEEYAIANIVPDGYYNGWCFPKNMNRYMDHVLVGDLSDSYRMDWMKTYLFFVKKLTRYHRGKQLLLKNPAHTARLSIIKRMFPNAKFVHIVRNPYEVYYSMEKFMRIVLPRYCVQRPPSKEQMKQSILKMYTGLYKTYLREKSQISNTDIIEISYESFVKDPLENTKRIYDHLELALSQGTLQKTKKYTDDQTKFKQSSYTMKEDLKKEIYDAWNFAFEAFNYSK